MKECMIQKATKLNRLMFIMMFIMLTFFGVTKEASAKADDSFMKTKKAEISIMDFGAKNQDNADDKTCTATANAFQKAFDKVLEYNCGNGEYVQINVPAGVYCINKRLKIRSNTYLKLDKDTVVKNVNRKPSSTTGKTGGPMLANYYDSNTKYVGYEGASNIVVDGGTWDGNVNGNDIDDGFSNILFIHAKNIIVMNTTVKSNYGGHLVEFAGVQNGHILNSTLSDYVYKTETAEKAKDKEAIQLDITHDSKMVPTFGSYDDTVCKDIVIKGNRIENFARGIGSHEAVRGIYNQDVLIQGNTFVNVPNEGILAYNYRRTVIDGNTFTNVGTSVKVKNKTGALDGAYKETLPAVPVEYPGDYQIVIRNNVISNQLAGNTADITLEDTAERVLGNTQITGNTISTVRNAISLTGTRATNVSGNNIINAKTGIIIQYSNGDAISNNAISNCLAGAIMNNAASSNLIIQQNVINGGSSYGIRLFNNQNSTVANNKINATANTGIYVYSNCSGINVMGNAVANVGTYGILLNNVVANSVVQNNTVVGSGLKGITVCTKANNIQIINNEIGLNKMHGIDVNDNSANITISGNKVYNNAQIGVYINANVTAVNIANNSVYDNVQNGIGLKSNCTNTTIQSNAVHRNGKIGISINSGCNNVVVSANTVNNSGSNGIGISDLSANTSILGNSIANSKKHGISIYNQSVNANIQNNTVNNSTQMGICVSKKSTNAKVWNNKCSNNKKNAIYVTSSDSASIKNNKLSTNKVSPVVIKSSKKCNVKTFAMPTANAVKKTTNVLKVTTSKDNTVTAYVGKTKLKVSKNSKAKKDNFTAKYPKLKKNNKVTVNVYDKGKNQVIIAKTVK